MLNQKTFGLDFEIDPAFGNWFAGFVDGEGHFALQVGEQMGKYSMYQAKLEIHLRFDDQSILEEIRERLQCGIIRYQRSTAKTGNAQDEVQWIVCNSTELKWIILPLFEKFPLRAKKKRDFEIWKRAVEIIFLAKHSRDRRRRLGHSLPDNLLSTLKTLADDLKQIRKPIGVAGVVKPDVADSEAQGTSHPVQTSQADCIDQTVTQLS